VNQSDLLTGPDRISHCTPRLSDSECRCVAVSWLRGSVIPGRGCPAHADEVFGNDSWENISHAYTMYAESTKTNDPTKRGRFNEGEKAVVCLNIEASVTTVSGQIRFQGADKRWETDEHTTVGSIFSMKFELSQADYMDICRKALLLIPPKDIATTFNGKEIRKQGATNMFDARLRTPLNGRNEPRKTEVRLYECTGKPWLYEMDIPIMELDDDKWSINVMQKVPLGRDRNSVSKPDLKQVGLLFYCPRLARGSAVQHPQLIAHVWRTHTAGA